MLYDIHHPTNLALKREQIYIRHRVTEWQDDWPLHTHDGFEIYFFQQGIASYIIGNDIYQLSPGDMLIFSGDVLHRVNPIRSEPYVRSYVNFTAPYLKELLSDEVLERLLSIFATPNGLLLRWDASESEEIDALLKLVYTEREKESYGYEFMMKSTLAHLLFKIYRRSKSIYLLQDPVNSSMKESNVKRVLQFINTRFHETMQLEDIANALHLNKYYMCHCFKEITGHTINNFITRRRIDEAKKLLANTNDPLTVVSEKIGFSNSIHFSRTFKQFVGVSPQQYRKLQ